MDVMIETARVMRKIRMCCLPSDQYTTAERRRFQSLVRRWIERDSKAK
jgi:hypothetical protein